MFTGLLVGPNLAVQWCRWVPIRTNDAVEAAQQLIHIFLSIDRNFFVINNDVLRRIRYTFDFNDEKMMALFALADHKATRAEISAWLKKDEDPEGEVCKDEKLAVFLNGLIIYRRGKRDGPQPEPEKRLSNNAIFMKLKIALNLKAEDVLEILELAGFAMSKHELSAFFRKPGHKHYRTCHDQILRNFLKGVQLKYRRSDKMKNPSVWK